MSIREAEFPLGAPKRRRADSNRARRHDAALIVVDDLPDTVPVTEAEIDAVARYCQDIIKHLLGR